jgi:hypothetical protein
MPMMPYHVEKGAVFTIFESFLNDSTPMAVNVLRALRDPSRNLDDSRFFKDATLRSRPPMTGGSWSGHFADDWLGPSRYSNHDWTGYWIGYRGDVGEIVRTTLRRALEVALDVDHDAEEVPATPERHWPIQILWHCGQPWFEGWVAWNQRSVGDGDVTVLFATPGHYGGVVRRRLTAPTSRQGRDYEENPETMRTVAGDTRRRGLMVVSHQNHVRENPSEGWRPTSTGQWQGPTIVTHVGEGPIITVAPSEAEGGVLADGRPFQEQEA